MRDVASTRCLEAYVLLWTVQLVASVERYPNGLETWVVPIAGLALMRREWTWVAVAHVAFSVSKWIRQPDQYNSDVWFGLLDGAVVFLGSFGKKDPLRSFGSTVRLCLGILYLSTGVWKANTSHLTTRTSCSTIFLVGLSHSYLGGFLAEFLAKTAGYVTVLVESAVGLLLIHPRHAIQKIGVVLGIALHVGIASAPRPNNIVAFSTMACARYILVVPEAASLVSYSGWPWLIVALLCGALNFRYSPAYAAFGFVVFSVLLAVIYDNHLNSSTDDVLRRDLSLRRRQRIFGSSKKKKKNDDDDTAEEDDDDGNRIAKWCVVTLITVYAFLLVPLGLQDQGNTHMFANLRVMGGGNHLILPTGLLQRRYAMVRGPGPFDGGVVRIDNTTNPRLRRSYPYELSHILSSESKSLLRRVGHTGREFIPLEARIHGPDLFPAHDHDPIPFATHAYELRRLIADAQSRGEEFNLTYVSIPTNSDGTTDWSQALTTSNQPVRVTVTQDVVSCVVLPSLLPCSRDEIALQPWPPTGPPFLIHLLLKILVFNPYPLIPGEDHSEMACSDG